MSNFKTNIEQITSERTSNWRESLAERVSRPWLKQYSSEIARRVLAHIEDTPGLTQTKLAEDVGVSAQQISKIVSGRENLTLETIYKLSQALKKELISFPDYKYSPKSARDFHFRRHEDTHNLFEVYKVLSRHRNNAMHHDSVIVTEDYIEITESSFEYADQ